MASIDRMRDGWRARWRTPEGASRSQNFKRKADAERFLTTVEATKLVGGYVDRAAGRVTSRSRSSPKAGCRARRSTLRRVRPCRAGSGFT